MHFLFIFLGNQYGYPPNQQNYSPSNRQNQGNYQQADPYQNQNAYSQNTNGMTMINSSIWIQSDKSNGSKYGQQILRRWIGKQCSLLFCPKSVSGTLPAITFHSYNRIDCIQQHCFSVYVCQCSHNHHSQRYIDGTLFWNDVLLRFCQKICSFLLNPVYDLLCIHYRYCDLRL